MAVVHQRWILSSNMVVTIPEASQWLDHDTKHDQTVLFRLVLVQWSSFSSEFYEKRTFGTNLTLDLYEVAELKHSLSLIIDSSLICFFCSKLTRKDGYRSSLISAWCHLVIISPYNLDHFWVYNHFNWNRIALSWKHVAVFVVKLQSGMVISVYTELYL